MNGDISVNLDVAGLLAYAEDRLLGLFGKDAWSRERKAWFKNRTLVTARRTEHVKCVGMDMPVRLDAIYQPARLQSRSRGRVSAADLHRNLVDAVILAGPGRGNRGIARNAADIP